MGASASNIDNELATVAVPEMPVQLLSSFSSGSHAEAKVVSPTEMRVSFLKGEQESLGFQLVSNSGEEAGQLKFLSIDATGLLGRWNAEHEPEEQILPGYYIASVNGVCSSRAAMILQLHQVGMIEMVVSSTRPEMPYSEEDTEVVRVSVTVPNTYEEKIGLSVAVVDGNITVVRIRDGSVKAWNEKHPESEVRTGDRIVFANACSKADMMETLRTPGMKHLVFWRGPEDANGFVLDERSFDRLPEELIPESAAGSDACGICLEDWEAGEHAVRLACGHYFHRACCQQWLMGRSALCPLCQWAADCPQAGQPRPRCDTACSKCSSTKQQEQSISNREDLEEEEEEMGKTGSEMPLVVQQLPLLNHTFFD